MSIKNKDFVPAKKKGGMFKSGSIENFGIIVEECNQWIGENSDIKIINVETVVLPNIHDSQEEGSEDTELWTGGESSSQWYQLIRIWYRE
jgi:hypothetical protein